jgi:hypothetical protein
MTSHFKLNKLSDTVYSLVRKEDDSERARAIKLSDNTWGGFVMLKGLTCIVNSPDFKPVIERLLIDNFTLLSDCDLPEDFDTIN